MLDPAKDFNDRNLSENEEVIAKTINYLRFKDPANANREYAIGLLQHMQEASRGMADTSKLDFEEFVDRYNQSLEK